MDSLSIEIPASGERTNFAAAELQKNREINLKLCAACNQKEKQAQTFDEAPNYFILLIIMNKIRFKSLQL